MAPNLTSNQSASGMAPKLIAFYLTQFHPIPENDLWWGKGFTEWTNTTKAKGLFPGHYQPHLPSDLGFYDLRVRETRHEQIKLAKKYGIDGFCYHYYWFSGTRILHKPLDDMLTDPLSDMPFCLCWANENWTRRWDAADHEILMEQRYRKEDDLNFIKSLIPFFQDERYIRVDGKPFLIVYRPQHIPDAYKSSEIWRQHCRDVGVGEIHICAALTHGNENYSQYGFDSGIEFPPHNLKSANINEEITFHSHFSGNVMQYETIAQSYLDRTYKEKRVFKTVFPSWDNTARTKERALVVINGTPDNYEFWLSRTIDDHPKSESQDRLIFINAWNEWAEGCHLEPDQVYGHGFLQATANAKSGHRRFSTFSQREIPVNLGVCRLSFWQEERELLKYHACQWIGPLKFSVNRRPWLRALVLPVVKSFRFFVSKISRTPN